MKPVLSAALVALAAACQLPSPESLRPRGVDVWVEGGQGTYLDRQYGRGSSDDWSVGANVHFDLVYPDEE